MNPDARRPSPNHEDQLKKGQLRRVWDLSPGRGRGDGDPRLSSRFLTAQACLCGAAQWDAPWGSGTTWRSAYRKEGSEGAPELGKTSSQTKLESPRHVSREEQCTGAKLWWKSHATG